MTMRGQNSSSHLLYIESLKEFSETGFEPVTVSLSRTALTTELQGLH